LRRKQTTERPPGRGRSVFCYWLEMVAIEPSIFWMLMLNGSA
jgi:hypothetical protein